MQYMDHLKKSSVACTLNILISKYNIRFKIYPSFSFKCQRKRLMIQLYLGYLATNSIHYQVSNTKSHRKVNTSIKNYFIW